jgi:DNA invertase Pin-like site-specific DNA recombinase
MVGAVAEIERSLIRERVLAGIDRARRQGKKLGAAAGSRSTKRRSARKWSPAEVFERLLNVGEYRAEWCAGRLRLAGVARNDLLSRNSGYLDC